MSPLWLVIGYLLAGKVYANNKLVNFGLDACQVYQFCNGNASVQVNTTGCCKPCSCDRSCVVSRNCCPDADIGLTSLPENPYSRYLTCESSYIQFSERMHASSSLPFFNIVSSCPDGYVCRTEQPNFSTLNKFAYVMVSDKNTGTIFINRQCAFCHGITDIIEWTIEIYQCLDPLTDVIEKVSSGKYPINYIPETCRMMMLPPKNYQGITERFICKSNIFDSECQLDLYDARQQDLCASGIFEIFDTAHFKNPFCFSCNVLQNEAETYLRLFCRNSDTGKSIFSKYGNLFRLLDGGEGIIDEEDVKCNVSQAFDIMQEICRPMYCPLFSQPRYGKCEHILSVLSIYRFMVFLKFTLVTATGLDRKKNPTSFELAESIFNKAMHWTNTRPDCLFSAHVISYAHTQTSETGFYVAMEIIAKRYGGFCTPIHENFERISQYDIFVDILSIKFKVGIINIPVLYNDTLFQSYPNDFDAFRFRIDKMELVKTKDILFSKALDDPLLYFPLPVIHVFSQISCPFFKMNLSEACNVLSDDLCNSSSLSFKRHFRPISEMTKHGEIILLYGICVQEYNKLFSNIQVFSMSNIGIGSLITSSLSLICIVFTVISMVTSGQIEPIARRLFLSSAGNLFLAQATFQLGSGWINSQVVCTLSGMLIHFTWLATVFSYNGFCLFAKYKLQSTNISFDTNMLMKCFFIYTYVTPVALVLINITYDLVTSGAGNIGYGETVMQCNINMPLLRGIIFALPIFSTVLYNLYVFITLFLAKRSPTSKTNPPDQRGYCIATVYFQLLMFTGISWLIGFINEFIQSDVLGIVFAIAVGGQGIGFCLGFLCQPKLERSSSASSQSKCDGSISTDTVTSNKP